MLKVARPLVLALSVVLLVASAAAGPAGAVSHVGASQAGAVAADAGGQGHGRPEDGRVATREHGPRSADLACVEQLHAIPHQGLSCRVANGLFKVKLRDGAFTYTHGPDPVHHHDHDATPAENGQTGDLGTFTNRNPICTSANLKGPFGFHAIIAIPSDGFQTITPTNLRTRIQEIDGAFYKSAVESGSAGGADLVFDCDSTGAIAVDVVRLGTSTAASGFDTIVSDLQAAGYKSTTRNYAVYYTATMDAGGQGSLEIDSTNTASNLNNTGGRYAIDYGVPEAETLFHEIGHNLGAVQPGSPHATGTGATNGGHCWEGQDVMCYNDGASTDPGTITWNCLDFDHFDCGHDDYFDAAIGAGQGVTSTAWLASHFNIGACYDVFVVNRACATASDTTPPAVAAPTQGVQALGQISDGLVPVSYSWSAADASGISQYDVWISTNGTFHQVTIASATAKSGTWSLTPGSTYQMAVRAKDGAGNWSTYAYGPTFVVDAYQEKPSTSVSYSTGWTAYTGSYFGGQQYSSATTGASVTVKFTGRGFAWIAAQASNRGQADVWVDTTYIGRFDTYASAVSLQRAVLTRNWTTSAGHTVIIKVVGTSGRPTIDVDAFIALR